MPIEYTDATFLLAVVKGEPIGVKCLRHIQRYHDKRQLKISVLTLGEVFKGILLAFESVKKSDYERIQDARYKAYTTLDWIINTYNVQVTPLSLKALDHVDKVKELNSRFKEDTRKSADLIAFCVAIEDGAKFFATLDERDFSKKTGEDFGIDILSTRELQNL